jgi:hypothetical protein
MRAALLFFLCLGLAISASCGPGDSSNGTGTPKSTKLGMLTTAQAGTECDYVNNKQGGYGRSVTCADGSMQTTDPDKASCVADVPVAGAGCPTLTVGDLEDCANAVGTNLCSLPTASACAAFNACLASLN